MPFMAAECIHYIGLDLKEEKRILREKIWGLMTKTGVVRFPLPAYGRIPNFKGSEEAAEKLRQVDEWKNSTVVFSNPDYAQKKVRENVLKDGKILIMASPRLKQGFILVDPDKVKGLEEFASTIKGAFDYGKKIDVEQTPKPDLIITGCVAVDMDGFRLGKGYGYGDQEIKILKRKFGKIPVAVTVHDLQIVDRVPHEKHDERVDIITTPTKNVRI